jgi:CheY-like chemotaxis protein/HPt (histidine-containing phosphotransfer) domain-containing protein
VGNGIKALKALETVPYDLVLMDVQMPVMDGLETTRQIRRSHAAGANRHVPVVAMTAHVMQGDRERCFEAGMNDYMAKPVSPRSLVEVLARWLPGAKEQRDLADDKEARPFLYPSTGPVIFDRATLFERLLNDEELMQMALEAFLDDIPRQLETMQGYLDAGDVSGVQRQAHTIKGAAANVNGEIVQALAHELEQAGMTGDLIAIRAGMNRLAAQFELLKEEMLKELSKNMNGRN